MADFSLTAKSPLGGARHEFDRITIAEISGRAIVSIATPNGGESALAKAMAASYKVEIPKVGNSTTSTVANARFLGTQPGQTFIIFDNADQNPAQEVASKLESVAYLTDQSDSWVMIGVSGERCRKALERICPINLHSSAFAEGQVARTMMEHMAAIIFRDGPDSFVLMSLVSSAKSFEHAIEVSARNIS